MILDVSDALGDWQQPVLLKTVTTTTVDFVPTTAVTGVVIQAVVQPTKKTILNADTLDWSRAHYTFHTMTPLLKGQLIEYKGKDYKLIEDGQFEDYGYCEVAGEYTMQATMAVTP